MREIKFRAWNKEHKAMEYSFCVAANGKIFGVAINMGKARVQNIDLTDYLSVMQYTGLKDKNGKEIYEGDLLKVDGVGQLMPVEWWSGSAGFNLAYLEKNTCEVVGNKYEME